MARPPRPVLSRDRIVACATALIDAEGLAALSARRLARQLGVQAPSLYHHFASKAEILAAVADAVGARIDVSMFRDDPWPTALRAWARGYRATLLAHPHLVPFLARHPGHGGRRVVDAVRAGLVDAGWPAGPAIRVAVSLRDFVVGSALGSPTRATDPPDSTDPPDVTDPPDGTGRRDRPPSDPDPSPSDLDRSPAAISREAFELGLTALVQGYIRLYQHLRRTG